MEGPTYKGREGMGKREKEGPPVITVSPGPRGARIVTGCTCLGGASFYRQDRSDKLPLLNLLTCQKSVFFAPQEQLVVTIQVKLMDN